VDTSQRLLHSIKFVDESTPQKRAKPAGILGCEIRVKVTPADQAAAGDPDEFKFITMDTASPHTVNYESADGGKTAHYILRWVKRGDIKGPWSETVSATIPA
jgi:hypothetical protein